MPHRLSVLELGLEAIVVNSDQALVHKDNAMRVHSDTALSP